ncbi:MAG: polysaccharide biosynthesis protein [Bdellovibrionales bacterium]
MRFRRVSWKHLLPDTVLLLASLYLSLWLRTGWDGLDQHLSTLNHLAVVFLVIRLGVFYFLGIYQSLWRYISSRDASRLALAVILSTPLMISVTFFSAELGSVPRSFFIIDALLASVFLMGLRLTRRRLFEWQMQPRKGSVSLGKLIIYGAGQNGRLLAQRLLSDPHRDRDLLGFIDDSAEMSGKRIQGLPVLGAHTDLEEVLRQSGCTELVVAITHPPADLMRDLVVLGRKLNVRVLRIAHFDSTSIARSEALYRQVELKDLLTRPAAAIDIQSIQELVRNKVVLVTGAGGSIGSELARQLARLGPSRLLLLDHSEFNLFEIDRELRPNTEDFSHVVPLLVDIKDKRMVNEVFTKHRPQVVFHAAAYKHVHLVQANVASAVLNNVQGTMNLLEASESQQVERFVMISSDKAVNPVGAMGATKRVCELLTSQMGLKTGKRYSSVRFGNVLGSSGSLIPVLRQQIESGGPVTITHPDMTRYFMLIPEAVSLVLMSATLSEPGDVNVLNMGDPVRILDLAKNLIALMGRREDEISIAFTGARPGEKMFEELCLTGHERTTRHPDIMTIPMGDHGQSSGFTNLSTQAQELLTLAEQGHPDLLSRLIGMANQSIRPPRDQGVLNRS